MDLLVQVALLDGPALAVLALGAALAGLLFGVAGTWRGIQRAAPRLPVWRILAHAGISRAAAMERAGSPAMRKAELRCTLCTRRLQCGANPSGGVPADCPNSRTLADLI